MRESARPTPLAIRSKEPEIDGMNRGNLPETLKKISFYNIEAISI
jgi:hypothetical protein